MIVSEANPFMSEIHDRMPVFLGQETLDRWLDVKAGTEVLLPASAAHLTAWPVSRRVNSSKADKNDRTLIEPHRARQRLTSGGYAARRSLEALERVDAFAARFAEPTSCLFPCDRLCFRVSTGIGIRVPARAHSRASTVWALSFLPAPHRCSRHRDRSPRRRGLPRDYRTAIGLPGDPVAPTIGSGAKT